MLPSDIEVHPLHAHRASGESSWGRGTRHSILRLIPSSGPADHRLRAPANVGSPQTPTRPAPNASRSMPCATTLPGCRSTTRSGLAPRAIEVRGLSHRAWSRTVHAPLPARMHQSPEIGPSMSSPDHGRAGSHRLCSSHPATGRSRRQWLTSRRSLVGSRGHRWPPTHARAPTPSARDPCSAA
jgi:hypothetical protein